MAKRPAAPIMGRASIFRNKIGGHRVQGQITPIGSSRFEAARRRLAKLAAREAEEVSDADTVEYLARGEVETRAYLKDNPA